MEIKAVLAEALNCISKARKISPPKSDVEISALRWELYASLQNTLDALAMTISDLGLRKPTSYSDLGKVLLEAGLLDAKTSDLIKVIARTRNILAHAYRRLSPQDLNEIVKEVLPLVERVIEAVKRILEERHLDPGDYSQHELRAKLHQVFRKHRARIAYLFGSRAKGLERPDSDYDIAVLIDKQKPTIMDEIYLALDIAEELKLSPDKVHVILLNNADPLLKARVLKEGIPIYSESEEERRKWERETYLEILHLTDLYAIYITRAFKKLKTTS